MTYFILALIFMLIQGFFSGIETGLVSILKPRLRHALDNNVKGARILDFFLSHPGYMLSTTLIGTNICIAIASNMAKQGADSLGISSPAIMLAMTALMSTILLMLEIIPKDWFRQQPCQRCLIFAYILYASYIVLYVPVRMMSFFTGLIGKIAGRKESDEDSAKRLMREDFSLFLKDSESAGIIDSDAAEILDKSLDFGSLRARDVMQTISNVHQVELGDSIEKAVLVSKKSGRSRLPVAGAASKQGERWKGLFSVYDAIFNIPESEWKTKEVSEILRPILSIDQNASLDEILDTAKKSKVPLLAVSDEKGMQIGIVTPNDVVKQLFG